MESGWTEQSTFVSSSYVSVVVQSVKTVKTTEDKHLSLYGLVYVFGRDSETKCAKAN